MGVLPIRSACAGDAWASAIRPINTHNADFALSQFSSELLTRSGQASLLVSNDGLAIELWTPWQSRTRRDPTLLLTAIRITADLNREPNPARDAQAGAGAVVPATQGIFT